MIKHYLLEVESYLESYTVENIEIKGDVIQFSSNSACGNYPEKCQINLLDVMVWLYSKSSDSNEVTIGSHGIANTNNYVAWSFKKSPD